MVAAKSLRGDASDSQGGRVPPMGRHQAAWHGAVASLERQHPAIRGFLQKAAGAAGGKHQSRRALLADLTQT